MKIRAKRGRPRLKDVDREPNGRPSRSKRPADTVALKARAKHMKITVDQAKDARASTYIGTLAILGHISDVQHKAAEAFLELRLDYLRSKMAPGREFYDSRGEVLTAAYEDWCRRVGKAYEYCRSAIQEAQNENRSENLWAALDLIIIQNRPMPDMTSDIRVLCNALVRYFNRTKKFVQF